MGFNITGHKNTPPPYSLDLNKILIETASRELETFSREMEANSEEYPEGYAEIVCDLKELAVQLVRLIFMYLYRRKHPAASTKTAEITLLGRKTVYNYLQKEPS